MAVDRKQQMKEITERLEQGVKDIFTSEMYTTYLRTMAKFHNYSFNNTLLIAMQRPDATLVAGFNAWKNKFNRYVKKGEKGIQIIAPAPIKEVEESEKIDKDTGLTVLNENGEPEMERVEYVVPRFRVTTVFDVSQTDGEPIPSLEVNELTASVKDYALLTAAIEQVSPVPMRFDEIEGDVDKEALVKFNGFLAPKAEGSYLILNEGGYQIEGQTDTWKVIDEKNVQEQRFVQLVCEQTKKQKPDVVLHDSGVLVAQTIYGFDSSVMKKIEKFLREQKPELLHHQKFLENGTAERAKESGTEQNYNMIDGCVNNNPKKPRIIGNRISVLDRLHIKLEERKQKSQPQQLQQERSRKS